MGPGPMTMPKLQKQVEEDYAAKARPPVLAALKSLGLSNPEDHVDEAISALRAIAGPQVKPAIPFKDRVDQTIEWIEQLAVNPPQSVIKFGIDALDNALLPVEAGYQVVICAGTSGGKSALASQAVLASTNKRFAVFSMEMPWRSLVARMFSTEGKIHFSSLRQGKLNKLEFQRLHEAKKRMVNREIWIEDDQPIDVRAIAAKCRSFKRDGLDAIVVDYLQLVTPSSSRRDTNREREVAEISRSLKSLAMELNLVVIALSQLNDAGQLRESRAIGQDADIVLKICQDNDGGSIQVGKQRNGPLCSIPVTFDGSTMRFSAPENKARLPYPEEAE
jgi:replicative DNA helicase